MAKDKVRTPFTGVKPAPGYMSTLGDPTNGGGLPEDVTYKGDCEWVNGTPFVNVPAKPGVGRDSMRSPFRNPKIGSKARRD